MENKNVIRTIDFGVVPIRTNPKYTIGEVMATIDLTDQGDGVAFASIRSDYVTQQPFAVLLDDNLKEIVK